MKGSRGKGVTILATGKRDSLPFLDDSPPYRHMPTDQPFKRNVSSVSMCQALCWALGIQPKDKTDMELL